MPIQVILSQSGPLPLKATFQAPGDEPMYLEVNGSVWSQSANKMPGIGIQLDGQNIGASQIFSNGIGAHRAAVPAYLQVQLQTGDHALVLFPNTGDTLSDGNDFYTAVLHY
jgi:hypothetical protein